MTALDKQIGGSHYKKYPIQPWYFCEINKLTGAQTAVIDYVMRHTDKGGKMDLEKAIHHIELMIEHYYPEERENKKQEKIPCIHCFFDSHTNGRVKIINKDCECKCHKEAKDA